MSFSALMPVFDSAVKPVFSGETGSKDSVGIKNSRDLFHALVHVSENYPALAQTHHFLNSYFQHVNQHCAGYFTRSYHQSSVGQLLAKPDAELAGNPGNIDIDDILLQAMPVLSTEFYWLPAFSQAVTCQEAVAVDLYGVFLKLTAEGRSFARVQRALEGHFSESALAVPAIHSYEFVRQSEIVDDVFDFACVQLGLAHFPRVFLPEMLGFTLASCHAQGFFEHFALAGNREKLPDSFAESNRRRHQALPALRAVIEYYLEENRLQVDALWPRLQTGYWLQRMLNANISQRIVYQLQAVLSPRQAMHKLLQTLMPHAVGHHGNVRLGSKTIDEWFKETPFKGENFLATLLHSPLVDKAKPENSRLLKLYQFGGPMFGVLDENGKTVFREWLFAELQPGLDQPKRTQIGSLKSRSYAYGLKKMPNDAAWFYPSFEMSPHTPRGEGARKFDRFGQRELYYFLLNSDVYPEVLGIAKQKVKNVLNSARLFSRLPFGHYSHQAFEAYIETIYQREVKRYKPLKHQPKLPRAAYVWGITQFAPTILTDGSWLQSVYQLALQPSHPVGELLGKIYADEIGNGVRQQNHPYIYRQLLESLAIELPPVHTRAFAEYPGFISGAFDIPDYLMAIAKFPSAFLPELLGLNMAIELSGLGNQYLRLAQALKYWNINSYIVDLHTSIDNLASGHSALAMQAIRLYLDDVASDGGKEAMDCRWRRIYTGFRSLQTVSFHFKVALIWNYLINQRTANNDNYKQP